MSPGIFSIYIQKVDEKKRTNSVKSHITRKNIYGNMPACSHPCDILFIDNNYTGLQQEAYIDNRLRKKECSAQQ